MNLSHFLALLPHRHLFLFIVLLWLAFCCETSLVQCYSFVVYICICFTSHQSKWDYCKLLSFSSEANVVLPPLGHFATGIIFIHDRTTTIPDLMQQFSKITEECDLKVSSFESLVRIRFFNKTNLNRTGILKLYKWLFPYWHA